MLNRSIETVVEAHTVEGAKTIGAHAPDFTLRDHDGNPTDLAQLLDRRHARRQLTAEPRQLAQHRREG